MLMLKISEYLKNRMLSGIIHVPNIFGEGLKHFIAVCLSRSETLSCYTTHYGDPLLSCENGAMINKCFVTPSTILFPL